MINKRAECLKKANECVNGARQHDYGNPEDNFALISRLWSEYLNGCGNDICISAVDVTNMMILLKAARSATGVGKLDNYVDIAGYSACAYEMLENDMVEDERIRNEQNSI